MTRFQLVFRHPEGERPEIWDNNRDGEPHINGELIVDGETYVIRGLEWIVERDADDAAADGMKRFVCTLAAAPERDGTRPTN